MSWKSVIILILFVGVSHCSSIGDQKSLAVTIYNDQFAMVKDVRTISFDKGNSFLYFTDVSTNIQTETVTFKALNSPDSIRVYQQNYEANLVDTNAILQKYINKEVQIFATFGQTSQRVTGILLGYSSGYIVQTSKGIQVLNKIDGVSFTSLPDGFFTLPTLNWKVNALKALVTDCEVAYRTTGFSWKADYSITLNAAETKADIGGWVTIDNHSGKKYVNAKLKLIAGDVNTVTTPNFGRPMVMETMSFASAAAPAPSFSQKSFSDYHLYTLSQPVTLNESSIKQVEFIPRVYDIKVRKYNFITLSAGGYSEQSLKASNKIQFNNTKSNKLGIALPKGTVRVFQTDQADGSLEFIGESSIDHTPKDENITVTTGNAFDISADKYSMTRSTYGVNGGYTAKLNITIWNHKSNSAEIVVQLNSYYGDNLRITVNSPGESFEKVTSSLYRWKRVYAANEKYTLVWDQDYRP